ncbi:MAG: hypothetical protein OWP43_02065 [Sphaerochaetaceae bacterium]|nr:hypothetical protein [Sphaerochaetaceae bacterium]
MKYHIKNKNDRLIYKNSTFSKIVSFIFLLFFGWGSIDALIRGDSISTLIIPLILILVALIGILYIDRWVIDKEKLTLSYHFGVYPFISKKQYQVNELQKVEITHFVKGSFDENAEYKRKGRAYRAQVRFSIILKNDEKFDVEVIDEKKSGGTCEQAALLFSTTLGLPFTKDRDRDLDLDVGLRDIHKFRN